MDEEEEEEEGSHQNEEGWIIWRGEGTNIFVVCDCCWSCVCVCVGGGRGGVREGDWNIAGQNWGPYNASIQLHKQLREIGGEDELDIEGRPCNDTNLRDMMKGRTNKKEKKKKKNEKLWQTFS